MIAGPCERSTGSRCSFTRLLLLLPLPCQRWWPGRCIKVWTEKWEPSVSCWPLTAKSNLHVFSKLIVMMAFVDAIFCSCCNFSFFTLAAQHQQLGGKRAEESSKRQADCGRKWLPFEYLMRPFRGHQQARPICCSYFLAPKIMQH